MIRRRANAIVSRNHVFMKVYCQYIILEQVKQTTETHVSTVYQEIGKTEAEFPTNFLG